MYSGTRYWSKNKVKGIGITRISSSSYCCVRVSTLAVCAILNIACTDEYTENKLTNLYRYYYCCCCWSQTTVPCRINTRYLFLLQSSVIFFITLLSWGGVICPPVNQNSDLFRSWWWYITVSVEVSHEASMLDTGQPLDQPKIAPRFDLTGNPQPCFRLLAPPLFAKRSTKHTKLFQQATS